MCNNPHWVSAITKNASFQSVNISSTFIEHRRLRLSSSATATATIHDDFASSLRHLLLRKTGHRLLRNLSKVAAYANSLRNKDHVTCQAFGLLGPVATGGWHMSCWYIILGDYLGQDPP